MIDSSIFIDASRGYPPAIQFLREAALDGELWSVTPVRTEVRWAMRVNEIAIIQDLFERIVWMDVTTDLADRAGDHGRRWRRSHGLSAIDSIVAAAAQELDAQVATLNVRDFPMFPGLGYDTLIWPHLGPE